MAEKVEAASLQPLRNHTRRGGHVAVQLVTLIIILGLAGGAIFELVENLARSHITSGFGFWNNTAGFDISQTLIAYSPSTSTFGTAVSAPDSTAFSRAIVPKRSESTTATPGE